MLFTAAYDRIGLPEVWRWRLVDLLLRRPDSVSTKYSADVVVRFSCAIVPETSCVKLRKAVKLIRTFGKCLHENRKCLQTFFLPILWYYKPVPNLDAKLAVRLPHWAQMSRAEQVSRDASGVRRVACTGALHRRQ